MILDDIVRDSRSQLAGKKLDLPLSKIEKLALATEPPLPLAKALRGPGLKLIAEVKRASPSKGLIVRNFDPVQIARAYSRHAVAAISVLTETKYFLGSLDHLQAINAELGAHRRPLLRKDFIYDPYQVYEARAYGADALLLIVAILAPALLSELLDLTRRIGLAALVEVHNEREVEIALKAGAALIGINNRDLQTFEVDLGTTARLRALIPPDRVVVSESGIKTRSDLENLKGLGVNAVLVGESLLTSGDIDARIEELL